MESRAPLLMPSIPLAILLHAFSPSAIAAPGDTFSPYVFAAATHDSNLLRLDNSATGASTADTLRQFGAGMNVDWKVSRQQILLTAAVNENRFDRYSVLDYRGRDLRGAWNWQLDNHLSGDVGYANNVALGSFADQQTLVKNLRVQERSFFDGSWLFHPNWQIGLGLAKNKLRFPDSILSTLDRQDDVRETSLQYLHGAGNQLGIKLRDTTGNFPNQPLDFINQVDTGYRQREVLATIDWNISGHSRFQGQAGTERRTHDHFSSRDFSDITARGTYSWSLTGRTSLNVSAWRDIWAYDDLVSSYSRNVGFGLEPRWMPSSTITVSASIQRERRDFLVNPAIFLPGTPTRLDTAVMRQIAVTYQPAPSFGIKVSVGDDRRDSNQPLQSYYSRMVSIIATFRM